MRSNHRAVPVVRCGGGVTVAPFVIRGGASQGSVTGVLMGGQDGAETATGWRGVRALAGYDRVRLSPRLLAGVRRRLPRLPLGAWAVGRGGDPTECGVTS